jgi:hypothetical protein
VAPQDSIRIYIDGEPIDVKHRRLTGAQLRRLVSPPADNVWLDVVDARDEPIAPTHVVAIEPDMRFFTDRPRTIYIDKIPYEVHTAVLTETQLRALPTPPVADDYGIWKDIPDDLDDPIEPGELVLIANGDRFFTKPLPRREIRVTVNRQWSVTVHGTRQTGLSIKEAAIAQGVPIQMDFLLSRKHGPKFQPVGDDEHIRVHDGDEFRALDGDDNS